MHPIDTVVSFSMIPSELLHLDLLDRRSFLSCFLFLRHDVKKSLTFARAPRLPPTSSFTLQRLIVGREASVLFVAIAHRHAFANH